MDIGWTAGRKSGVHKLSTVYLFRYLYSVKTKYLILIFIISFICRLFNNFFSLYLVITYDIEPLVYGLLVNGPINITYFVSMVILLYRGYRMNKKAFTSEFVLMLIAFSLFFMIPILKVFLSKFILVPGLVYSVLDIISFGLFLFGLNLISKRNPLINELDDWVENRWFFYGFELIALSKSRTLWVQSVYLP